MLNDSGALQSRNEYDGYGITYPEVAGAQSDFRFVGAKGYITDDDTGLDMLGHRFYIPQLGRFLNQDPIGQKGGLNLYEYAGDNPVTEIDPECTQGEGDADPEEVGRESEQAKMDEELSEPTPAETRPSLYEPSALPERMQENIDRQAAIDALFRAGYGPQEINEIIHAFDGPIIVRQTEEPEIGYRYTTSPRERPGNWYSPRPYIRPGNAMRTVRFHLDIKRSIAMGYHQSYNVRKMTWQTNTKIGLKAH